MTQEQPVVYLVDDDSAVRKTLPRGLKRRGFNVETFESAQDFLDAYNPEQAGCLILDLSMPGMDGLDLQQELINRDITLPIIFITGHGSVPQSVQALRSGAIDFLEKPFLPDTLVERIEEALTQDQKYRIEKQAITMIRKRFDRLTARELEVCLLMIKGEPDSSSKQIAKILNISHRTVEQHRSRIFEKTQARSVSELSSLASRIDLKFTDRD